MKSPGILSALALFLCGCVAMAQTTLGELLDKKAKRLSAYELREQLVQRTLTGVTATGGALEVTYLANGLLHGTLLEWSAGWVGYGTRWKVNGRLTKQEESVPNADERRAANGNGHRHSTALPVLVQA